MIESFDEQMRRIWSEAPISTFVHLVYVDASHTICGISRAANVLTTTDVDQVTCQLCLAEHERAMENDVDVSEPDSNCNFCGDDYFEDESDASSPGTYCSEQCEVDEEEAMRDER